MRKPRDFDAELQALSDKARSIKTKRLAQLGELVIATGAAELDPELLAGALLETAATADAAKKEAWRKRGASFFRSNGTRARRSPPGTAGSGAPGGAGVPPPAGETSTT